MIEIRATFESEEEAIQWLQGDHVVPKTSQATASRTVRVEEPVEDDEPTETKKQKGKKAKAQDPAKVQKGLVKAIRDFIMEDKVANTRKVLPLMPDGQKDIKALSVEQAQEICMELGIDV